MKIHIHRSICKQHSNTSKKGKRTKENSSSKKAGVKIGHVGKSHKDEQTKKMCKMW